MDWKISMRTYMAAALLALSLISTAGAKTIYVDANAPGANNGSSWTEAYNYLQDALADADASPKPLEIHIAQGIYVPDSNFAEPNGTDDRDATFRLISGVAIKGGYAGFGEAGPDVRDFDLYETILIGEMGTPQIGDNCYHIVTSSGVDETAVLDGVTITAAYAMNSSNLSDSRGYGGGMYNIAGSPRLIDCTFSKNSSVQDGAGIYHSGGGRLELTRCVFYENDAFGWGGRYGGAISSRGGSLKLTECTFRQNRAFSGAGVYSKSTDVTVIRCTFDQNFGGTGYGAGVSCVFGVQTFLDCRFTRNTTDDGGAIFNSRNTANVINCLFAGNAGEFGGAVCNYGSSCDVTLTNCTFVANTAAYGRSVFVFEEALTSMANCILWNDGSEIWVHENSSLSIEYSNVQGGWPGEGNIDSDPLFRDPNGADSLVGTEDDDLRLSAGSPCIDAGNNSLLPASAISDLDDNPRRIDDPSITDSGIGNSPVVDMGAYEFIPSGTPIIGVSRTHLEFVAIEGGVNPDSQSFAVWNRGDGVLSWTAVADCNWLQIDPSEGISADSPNEITLNVDIGSLSYGKHTCVLSVFDPNTLSIPQYITVNIDIKAPLIGISPAEISLACPEGGPAPEPQILSIWNDGVNVLNWEIADACGWLTLSSNRGQSFGETDEVLLTVDPNGLDADKYVCTLIVSDPNAGNTPQTVEVTLDVRPPLIAVSSTEISFVCPKGGPAPEPQTLSIWNDGVNVLNWEIAEDCPWLTLSSDRGQSFGETDDVLLTVDANGLDTGQHTCTLIISDPNAGNTPQTVEVTLDVRPPLIAVSPAQMSFVCPKGGPNPEPQIISVWNSDIGVLNWEIAENCDWLQVAPATGSSTGETDEVLINIGATGLDGGTYNCMLTVSDPNALNSPQYITVNLDVQTSIIDLAPEQLYFTHSGGGGRGGPAPQTLSIWNADIQTLNWQLTESCNWVEASPVSGESSDNINEVTISINPDELPTNNETCILTISDPNSLNKSRTVTVQAHRLGTPLHVPSMFTTIQEAIDHAEDGDTVIIAPGTYTGPGNYYIRFNGKAITVRGTNPDDFDVVAATIIDCNQGGSGFIFDRGEDPNSILSGLKITNGRGWWQGGGGILCENSSPVISNCILAGNTANWGGGILSIDGELIIKNCLIIDNIAGHGGGIYAQHLVSATIENCVITGNTAGSRGGAIYGSSEAYHIDKCIIAGNKSGDVGGGIATRVGDMVITGCTITGNVAANVGGGFFGFRYPDARIANSIIAGNSAPDGPEIGFELWSSAAVSVSWSNIMGGLGGISSHPAGTLDWGAGNIDADPCFADPGYWGHIADPNIRVEPNDPNASWVDGGGDYRLKSQAGRWDSVVQAWVLDDVTSLCIDGADPNLILGLEPFPNGGRVNMGVYGATAEASKSYFGKPPCETIVAGDINGDCIIDGRDFALLAWNWSVSSPLLPGRATDPNPPDGAINVSGDMLTWTPGDGAISHDVYFGTTSPGTFQGNRTDPIFSPGVLLPETKYYWRIDEVGLGGTTEGAVWTFTTGAGGPPPPR